MKRLLAVVMVLVLCVCVAAPALGEDTHLIMAWWGNQSRNDTFNSILEAYSQENPGVTFDGQFVSWGDYWNKLATAAAGHNLPDIILMDYSYMSQYRENGLLADITPYVNSGVIDLSQFSQGIIDSASADGKIYAVCSNVNAPALLYNKTLLEENGVEIHDQMTLDEFVAISKTIYEKTGYKTNFAFGGNQFMDYVLRGVGHNLFTDGKLTATQEDFEMFFSYMTLGIKEGWMLTSDVYAEIDVSVVEQDPVVYGDDPSRKSWCTFLWSNQITALQNAAPEGVEIGITTWPSSDPEKSNYLKPGGFFAITSDCKNEEEAAKVVNYFSNNIEAAKKQTAIGSIMPAANVARECAVVLSDTAREASEYVSNVVSPNCSSLPEAEPVGANEFYAALKEIEEEVGYGMVDEKAAAQELFTRASALFK